MIKKKQIAAAVSAEAAHTASINNTKKYTADKKFAQILKTNK